VKFQLKWSKLIWEVSDSSNQEPTSIKLFDRKFKNPITPNAKFSCVSNLVEREVEFDKGKKFRCRTRDFIAATFISEFPIPKYRSDFRFEWFLEAWF